MKIFQAVLFFAVIFEIAANYFFIKTLIDGMSKEGWQKKCAAFLNETSLTMAVFPIKDFCTQLKCFRGAPDLQHVVIGFDFCVRSSTRCFYAEPNYDYPYPECCPKKDCSRLRRRFKPAPIGGAP